MIHEKERTALNPSVAAEGEQPLTNHNASIRRGERSDNLPFCESKFPHVKQKSPISILLRGNLLDDHSPRARYAMSNKLLSQFT